MPRSQQPLLAEAWIVPTPQVRDPVRDGENDQKPSDVRVSAPRGTVHAVSDEPDEYVQHHETDERPCRERSGSSGDDRASGCDGERDEEHQRQHPAVDRESEARDLPRAVSEPTNDELQHPSRRAESPGLAASRPNARYHMSMPQPGPRLPTHTTADRGPGQRARRTPPRRRVLFQTTSATRATGVMRPAPGVRPQPTATRAQTPNITDPTKPVWNAQNRFSEPEPRSRSNVAKAVADVRARTPSNQDVGARNGKHVQCHHLS